MVALNVTISGRSFETGIEVNDDISDADLKRIAVEIMNATGEWTVTAATLEHFVVDRFEGNTGSRFYIRPKVPFGSVTIQR